jgi:hypothetical protein
MFRRVLAIVAVAVVVVIGGWALWSRAHATRPAPAAAVPPSSTTPAPAPRASAPAVTPPAAAPGRAAAAPARPARRPATPKEVAPAREPAADLGTGTLHIDSDIAGAQVFVDRNYIGVTPVTSPDLPIGSHRVNIVAQGYDSIAETIDVEPGPRDLQFNFKEVRLDAAIDVVHKHRIGSCKGRLVATPQGLRYDTDDKDDRFTLPLTDLEVFEVDYMAKVLRVKGVKGKRYEFSDPTAANGDRLFVFHRDVDKARQRLKQGS